MSVDFPRAWEIARMKPPEQHHEACSWRMTDGALLCDCHVLYEHEEYKDDKRLYSLGGKIIKTAQDAGGDMS